MTAGAQLEIVRKTIEVELLSVGSQGPPGDPGNITPDQIGALAVAAELSEFVTAQQKANARANLELQNIDGGTF